MQIRCASYKYKPLMGSDEGQQDSERMGIDLKCGKTGGGDDEMWRVKDVLDIDATKRCLYYDGHVISGYILGKLAQQHDVLRYKC